MKESGESDHKPDTSLDYHTTYSDLTENLVVAPPKQVDSDCLQISASTQPDELGFENFSYTHPVPKKPSVTGSTRGLSASSRTKTIKTSSNRGCESQTSDDEDSSVFSFKRQDSSMSNSNKIQPTSYSDERPLACPFAVAHPSKFLECKTVMCRTILALKQHLHRRHRRPDFYCPRCFETFGSSNKLLDHQRRNQVCEVMADPFTDTMTPAQTELLKRRSSGSERSVWFAIFRLLFPEQPTPSSPHLAATDSTTAILHVTNVLRVLGPTAVQTLKKSVDIPYVSQDVVNEALNILAAEPVAELTQPSENARPGVDHPLAPDSISSTHTTRRRSRIAEFHSLPEELSTDWLSPLPTTNKDLNWHLNSSSLDDLDWQYVNDVPLTEVPFNFNVFDDLSAASFPRTSDH